MEISETGSSAFRWPLMTTHSQTTQDWTPTFEMVGRVVQEVVHKEDGRSYPLIKNTVKHPSFFSLPRISRTMFPRARFSKHALSRPSHALRKWQTRGMTSNQKREGDISDSFTSLSLPGKSTPLPDRFRQRKLDLVRGREDAIIASWERLLPILRRENAIVTQRGSSIVPEVRFQNLHDDLQAKRDEIRQRGAAIIRGVIPQDEARAYKFQIEEYVRQNPQTRGQPTPFPLVQHRHLTSPRLPSRKPPGDRTLLVTLPTSCPHPPILHENPESPNDLPLALLKPRHAHLPPNAPLLRRPPPHPPARRRQIQPWSSRRRRERGEVGGRGVRARRRLRCSLPRGVGGVRPMGGSRPCRCCHRLVRRAGQLQHV